MRVKDTLLVVVAAAGGRSRRGEDVFLWVIGSGCVPHGYLCR